MGDGRSGRPVGQAKAVSWQFPSSLLRTLGLADTPSGESIRLPASLEHFGSRGAAQSP